MGAAAVAVVVLLSVSACDAENGPSTTTTTPSPPVFPYPPFEIKTDVAVPLKQPLLGAAQFAVEMSVNDRLKDDPGHGAFGRRLRGNIAPDVEIADSPPIPDNYVADTGGAFHRAVDARELSEGTVEVSVCWYDTPGLYTKLKDGKVVGPDPNRPYSLQRPLVEWTDRPAADGTTPSGPRWLWVGEARTYDMTRDQIAAVCEPFKPEPFVQKMPDPMSTTVTPAP
ncbi:hypothetical protein M1247_12395 [Mycobacterium sp. 21AC1]|uniref:hypothetical protein n=1 Tax=[Mycobacterium] appelbergii TaxID=2939269 RepID=UPI002938D7AD|nr:hypothetical protein [Mycobacterium sp. 21AC1]MDV3125718.1 hypothetical protein [Mycobacterium sp. 21AC1]